jgi:hypothetical protein|tara:strand:- start:581 stop:754 length:174 start_codon:yes stop_codon:yes gene_type:complete
MYNPNDFCDRFAMICNESMIAPSVALENENICNQIAVIGESLDDKINNIEAILIGEF